jgi:hypothetical protein
MMARRPKRIPMLDHVGPTPERRAMDAFVQVPTERAGVLAWQAVTQDALDRYWRRGELAPKLPAENARRYEAGRRLRDAWQRSGLAGLVAGSYAPSVDGGRDPEARMLGAIDKAAEWRRLIRLVGPTCAWPCVTACCVGEAVGESMLPRLRLGLAGLADALRI